MFCPNCGKNLPDNPAFCNGCGTRLADSAPAAAPAAPLNPIIDNTIAAFKGFFSKNPVDAVDKAKKSTGLEWLILVGITAFFEMFYYALQPLHYSTRYGDFDALGLVNGLLETFILFFATSVAVLLLFKLVCKQDVAIQSVFNVTAVAMLPLGCSYLLSIVFGFVWSGLTAVTINVALIAFALLLYIAMQNMTDAKPSVWSFAIIMAIIFLVLQGYNALWIEIAY